MSNEISFRYLPLILEVSPDEIMFLKSRIDSSNLKVRLKFINNKLKPQTFTIGRSNTLPRNVFKPYIVEFFIWKGR
jgi:hypothetical protein